MPAPKRSAPAKKKNGTTVKTKKVQKKKKPSVKSSSKKKSTLQALRESQYRLNLALASAHMGIWEWNIQTNDVHWSGESNLIFGVQDFDGTFQSYTQLIHPEDRHNVVRVIMETVRRKKNYVAQHRIVRPGGSVHWIEVVGSLIFNKKGEPVKMTGSVQDISTVKATELECADWKIRYELIAASSGQVIYDYDIASGKIIWSGNINPVLGYTADEMGNIDTWGELIHPEDRPRTFQALETAEQRLEPFDVIYRFQKKDGTYISLHDKGFFIAIEKKARRMLGAMQDITPEIKADQVIQQGNLFRETVTNAVPGIMYVFDLTEKKNIYANQNIVSVLGYSPEEVQEMNSSFLNLIHPDDRRSLDRWSTQKTGMIENEYRIKNKKGEWRWFLSRDTPFQYDSEGKVTQIIGIAQDITESRQNSQRMAQSEQSYRELFDSVSPVYIQNKDGVFIDVNQSGCEVYGYAKEQIVGQNLVFLSAGDQNDIDAVFKAVRNAWHTPQMFIWYGKTADKKTIIAEVTLRKGYYFGEEAIIASAADITQSRLAEDNIRKSKIRFRNLIHDLNVGVLLQGPSTEVLLYNKAALSLLGMTAEQIIGPSFNPCEHAIHEDGTPFLTTNHPVRQAIRTLKPVRGVVMGIHRVTQQDIAWLFINAEPILDSEGQVREVICSFTDISERKKFEKELVESEQRFRTLQQASFGGIGLHNKGIILDCNQGLSDISGYSYEELVGSNGLDLIAPEWRAFTMDKIVTGYEKTYDVEGIRKDGTRYFLEIQAKNLPYHGQQIRVTEFRDITERKKAEEKILEQNAKLLSVTEDLKRKNEQLEEFTQIVSHNLRSPVGNILTLLNFFEGATSEDEKSEYLKLLKESGANTLNTLHELNEVLKIKQNKNIEKQDLLFETVYVQIRSMLSAKITETGAQIQCDFDEAPTIRYPKIYLESILLNLLSNALKYISPKRAPIIQIKTYHYHNQLILEIADNGLGINLERYGHQVFKLRKTFHRHPESRGIGLFMIKNQIEAMGGEITLKSNESEGTTFYINFNKHHSDGN